jgi:hypothetical protein
VPERATISQQAQVGVESTPGTAVPANKLLTSLGFDPSPNLNFAEFAPPGFKFNTVVALLQEWTQSGLTGYPTYSEIVYALASVLDNPTPTTASGVSTWIHQPKSSLPDTVATFTIERGDGVQAERVTNGIITEFGISFSRTQSQLSGSMLGKALETGITLTAAPTAIDLIPILPTQVDVYIDPTTNAFGTTKLTRCLSAAFNIQNRFGPLWVLNSTLSSFVTTVELKPRATLEVSLEADAVGMSFLADARVGTKRKMRIKATGPNIGVSSTPHLFQLDAYVEVAATGGLRDQDGVYAANYTFSVVNDATAGLAMTVTVKNGTPSL